jgi:hypothetical protein
MEVAVMEEVTEVAMVESTEVMEDGVAVVDGEVIMVVDGAEAGVVIMEVLITVIMDMGG